MSKIQTKLELIANVAIILVAVVLCVVLVKKFVLTDSAAVNEKKKPQIGAKTVLPDVDFSTNDKTLLMALKKDCRFCSESASFYQKLSGIAGEKGIRVIALFPHSVEEGQTYLKGLGVSVAENRQADFAALSVGGTPTLILTDKTGEIKKFWVGMLPPEKEKEVIDSLQ